LDTVAEKVEERVGPHPVEIQAPLNFWMLLQLH